jgi:uncharacterized protein involved in exopolysaccharide biosynthesis
VNDTPVITVIDTAVPPQERSRPKRSLLVFLSFTLASVATVIWVLAQEYLRGAPARGMESRST